MARTIKSAVTAVASIETRIASVITTEFAVVSSTKDAKAAAFALLNGLKTKEEVDPVRDALKAAYVAQYLIEIGTDPVKAKAASDMFWSRTVARATELGFVKPVASTPEAVAAAKKRADKKAADEAAGKAKVDGRTLKTGANKSNKGKSASTVIVPETDDDVLQEALDFAMEHQAQFLVWFMRESRATKSVKAA